MYCYWFFRASCRIRTNDPEITNHVLWPTELKRRVGSYLHRAATTNYLCYVPVLEDSKGAGRARLPVLRFLRVQRYKIKLKHETWKMRIKSLLTLINKRKLVLLLINACARVKKHKKCAKTEKMLWFHGDKFWKMRNFAFAKSIERAPALNWHALFASCEEAFAF